MTPAEQLSMVAKAQTGDIDARNSLVEFYVPLIRMICDRKGKYRDEDLIQYCNLGVMRAIETFNANSGTSVKTYLCQRVAFLIKDYWRSQLPSGARRAKQSKGFGKHETHRTDFSEAIHPIDEISDLRLNQVDLTDFVGAMCDSFGGQNGQVLRLRFIDGLNMLAIGDRIGISESRVSQLISQLLPLVKSRIEEHNSGRALRSPAITFPKEIPKVDTQPQANFSVSQLSRAIVNAKESDLVEIDRTIAEIEASLAAIKDVRRIVRNRLGHVDTKKKPRSGVVKQSRWEEKIFDYVSKHGAAKPATIADAIDTANVSVGVAVSKSPRLTKTEDGFVAIRR